MENWREMIEFKISLERKKIHNIFFEFYDGLSCSGFLLGLLGWDEDKSYELCIFYVHFFSLEGALKDYIVFEEEKIRKYIGKFRVEFIWKNVAE